MKSKKEVISSNRRPVDEARQMQLKLATQAIGRKNAHACMRLIREAFQQESRRPQ